MMKVKRVRHLLTLLLLAGIAGCTAAGPAGSDSAASGTEASGLPASSPAASDSAASDSATSGPTGAKTAASDPAASQAAASGPAAQPATCTTHDGIAVQVTDFRPTGIDIELLFPEGYDATRAGVTVAATHWQFAANSGAYKSPTHYLFALQPRSPAGDSGAAGPTAPPDTAAVTVERIRTASGADAVLRFTLQAGEQGVTITDCR